MKELERNPIHLYVGSPCAIFDSAEPVSDTIEGCDYVQDKIIAERVNWSPTIIKPILRDISDITSEEALEVANLVWFARGLKRIEKVEIKTTPLFPYAAIYFDWSSEQRLFEIVDGKIEYKETLEEIVVDNFILSLDNDHHTLKLFRIDDEECKLIPMPIYQSHKVTAYLIRKGFNLGILEEGSYIIKNK